MDRAVISLLQSNALLIGKVKTFKEVHLDFLALESQVYHFDCRDALNQMYGRVANAAYPMLLSRKLASMCIILNEHPNIRYQQSSAIAREIAGNVHRILTEYKARNPTHVVHGEDSANSDRERGQLLILDRTFDPLSPFMHEYTYQAMANDLLEVDAQGMISYDVDTGKGSQTKETILNSEADELWKEFRHKHIAKVISSLKERMDDILTTNAGAKLFKKGKENMDMSAMAAAVKNLPEYQQMMSNYGRHVAVATQCMRAFSALDLIKYSNVEQTLSTGMDEDGRQVKGRAAFDKAFEALTELTALEKSKRDAVLKGQIFYIKIRLLAVYFISQRPINAEEKGQLLNAAEVRGDHQQVFMNLENLMGPVDNAVHAVQASNTSSAAAAKGGFFTRLLGGSRPAEKITATAEGEYTDTRHVCQLKLLLDQLATGGLPLDKYPTTGPAAPGGGEAKQTAQSVRKYKVATDRWGGAKANASTVGGRLLVFVAGGVTYTEMREAYDATSSHSREVVVGSSHIITPKQFIADIEELDK